MTSASCGVAYCRGRRKRLFDLVGAIAALVLLSPMLFLLSVLVLLLMGRPILFVQERVGMEGRRFGLLKFRTMRTDGRRGLAITGAGDPRVTPLGRILRASKLDELPQLINVLKGEMSIVGPRPEVLRYVETYSAEHRQVLFVRPGLTDPATLLFRNEEALLGSVEEGQRDAFYKDTILPRKLEINLQYLSGASCGYDLRLIGRTVTALLKPDLR